MEMAVSNNLNLAVAAPQRRSRLAGLPLGVLSLSSLRPRSLHAAALSCSCATMNEAVAATSIPIQWSEFAKRVSGEWDGFEAEFNTQGKPVQLPESVVPDAFREWEVDVYDWQTQCPTLALSDSVSLSYKNIRLLPTVGCEADAATRYSVQERVPGADAAIFAYHPSGCYVAVWPLPGASPQLELEHCLVNPADPESRVRIIQIIRADSRLTLLRINVCSELWYGPFRNGDQLGGCAIGNSAFASTTPLDASLVSGAWEGRSYVASLTSSDTGLIKDLVEGDVQRTLRDSSDLILLPRSCWCSVREDQGHETYCEVGWLFGQQSITSRCSFSNDSKLKEISMAWETKE